MSAPKVDSAPLFTPREIKTAYGVYFTATIAVVTLLALAVFGHLTGASGARIMGATLIGGTALMAGSMLFIFRKDITRAKADAHIKYNKFRQQLYVAIFICAVVFGLLGITGTLAASDVAKGSLIGSSLLTTIHQGYIAEDKTDYLITAMMASLFVLNALASTNVITGDAVRYALGGSAMLVSCAFTAKAFYDINNRPDQYDIHRKKWLGLFWVAEMVVGVLGVQGTLQTAALLANSNYIKDQAVGVVATFALEAIPLLQQYNSPQNAPQQASA